MLSRPQQILLKRAQREAGMSDDDYRDALQMIADCRSSTSPALTDRHLDKLLGYFEAIHWRGVDAGTLQPSGSAAAVFRQRGCWAAKNTRQETSRDRFTGLNLGQAVADLEGKLRRWVVALAIVPPFVKTSAKAATMPARCIYIRPR